MHLLSVFSLRNRALIALLTIVIGVFGGIALTSLKQELFPSISLPNLTIVSTYRGASPDVVENDVSTPIESAIQGIDGLESTSATSGAGVSTISASFAYGTDLARAEQKIQLAINRIENQLPEAVDTQVVAFSLSDLPVVVLAITSDLDADELSARLRDETIVDLANLPGVGEASLSGASGQRVTITPDTEALFRNGLSNQSIRDALDANGVLLATGVIDEGDQELTVQAGSQLTSADEIAALPLLGGREVVTIGDVAEVEIVSNPVTAISRVNGEPSLTISITKAASANTVEVSHVIQDALPALAAALGSNTEFTAVFDQAPFIEQSIESLATEGVLGLVFAVVVILIFLLSIRSTLVTAISIPASVLVTFIGMWATGYSMNVLTLGALTIAIGRVVDDSIVVIENIKRHLSLGEQKREAVLSAVKEVASAITASTATTVAVFLPIALVSDVTGELFRPFALTVTIALIASLFVSLTIVPVLAYWFLKAPRADQIVATEDELEKPTRLQKAYLPALNWTLRHPVLTLSSAALVLAGTVGLYTLVPTNFVGDSGQNTINVTQSLPAGSNLDAIDAASQEVEETLLDIEGIEVVQVSIGSDGGSIASFFRGGGGADATYSITTDPDVDQEELRRTVTAELDDLEGVGEVSVGSGGGGFSNDVTIDLRAADADVLAEATSALLDDVQDLDITSQAESNLAVTQPFLSIRVDRATAAEYGLSEIAVGGIVANSMLPAAVGSVAIDDTVLSVYITDPNAPVTVQELRDFEIPTSRGLVPLSELATIEEVDAPAQISTERGIRTATITVTPSTPNLAVVTPALEQAIVDADLPDGVSASVGGVAADQAEGFGQLYLALLAAILIVYTIMVATFRSLRQPLLLLISIPFAATGAFVLQLISGIPFGAASIIGLLMLVGIVVTNAIVLIDLVNQYRERGMDVREALRHGGARRLRPILMTALATIGALFFLTIGITGHGGFISQPLGIVVTGGLISSTLLTLLVLPALYWLVEGAKERRTARRAARAAA